MIGFEILNYQTFEDTLLCVQSILENVSCPQIVIVDNASTNNSVNILKEHFKNKNNIKIIDSKENLGFAKGNNLGYEYLRLNYDCDFICCINSDTRLIGNSFETKVYDIYKEYNFDVFAPKVILKDSSIQSFNPVFHDIDYYQKELSILRKSKSHNDYLSNKSLTNKLMSIFPNFMGRLRKYKQILKKPYPNVMSDVVLHGCFLVFSKHYVKRFNTAFDDRTFMYREEELLYLRLMRNNMHSLYCEDVCIQHLEDSSTNAVYKKKEDKYQFIRENQIKSLEILISEMSKHIS